MKLAGLKRNTYSKDKVKQLRKNRMSLKAKDSNVQDMYIRKVGELRAAGHMVIKGFRKLIKSEHNELAFDKGKIYETQLSFQTLQKNGLGDAPHIEGYLESASDADKGRYRLKGWFNEDGSLRIEIVQ
jgi:hypothetical protein